MTELFRIKPLEWKESISGLRAVVGDNIVSVFRTFRESAWTDEPTDKWWWTAGDKKCQPCTSPEEGKQLAEQHWRDYIKQALVPVEESK